MDPAEIASWPDHVLFSLARNQSAKYRLQALRVLVERNSRLASHSDLAQDAARIRQENVAEEQKQRGAVAASARETHKSKKTALRDWAKRVAARLLFVRKTTK